MIETFVISFTIGAFFGVLFMGSAATVMLPAIESRRKHYFIAFYVLVSFFIIVCCGDFFTYEKPQYVLIGKTIVFLEYLLPSLIFVLMTRHLLFQCGKEIKKSKLFYTVTALWVFYFVLLIIAQFTDTMYVVTPENSFERGPLHTLLLLPLLAIMTLNISALFLYRKALNKRTFKHFLFYLFPTEIALILHPFFNTMIFVIVAVFFCAVTLFTIVLSEQVFQYSRQHEEILDQRAKITILQMRPHFIYNTMTSIYYLCEQDPKKAQQVTLDFTNYMRRIFNAVVSNGLIPFSEESEHTRAYVNIALAQIGERLQVDFDTPHIAFSLPPLTLQPLVENAVKHGMNPDSGMLHISVKTRKTETGSEITVTDNGVGFDPERIAPGSTLANIRERLDKSVNGTMTIESSSAGTTVTIFVPDSKQHVENRR